MQELPEYQAQISQQTRTKVPCNTAISKIFSRYDVIETSYHFLSQRIDLHLCDDLGRKYYKFNLLKTFMLKENHSNKIN